VGSFLCTLVHGLVRDDERDIREQDGWDQHAAFMDQLVDDGVIIVGGPVGRSSTSLSPNVATARLHGRSSSARSSGDRRRLRSSPTGRLSTRV
jgi:hypothetical protein